LLKSDPWRSTPGSNVWVKPISGASARQEKTMALQRIFMAQLLFISAVNASLIVPIRQPKNSFAPIEGFGCDAHHIHRIEARGIGICVRHWSTRERLFLAFYEPLSARPLLPGPSPTHARLLAPTGSGRTMAIDHHQTNGRFAPTRTSTAEVRSGGFTSNRAIRSLATNVRSGRRAPAIILSRPQR
jgi:hypothetical protein